MRNKKIFLLLLLFCFLESCSCQKRNNGYFDTAQTIQKVVVDTGARINNTSPITFQDTIQKSEYYQLLDKTIEQKQFFYDSTLNTLSFWAAIIGILIGIITLVFAIVAFMGFSKIKDIQAHVEDGLDSKIGKKVTDKYEADISEIKNRLLELEREDTNAGKLKDGEQTSPKESPNPFDTSSPTKTSPNPFDQK